MDLLLPALLCTAAIALWASAALPEYLVALLFFTGATILRVAPLETVFSGFFSAAFWLVLSGFVLGTAIRKMPQQLFFGRGRAARDFVGRRRLF